MSIDNVPQKQTQKTGRMKAVENAARCWAIVRVVLRNTVSTVYISVQARPGVSDQLG